MTTSPEFSNNRDSSPYASEIAQAISLVESGDWDLAAKICLPIWQHRRYGNNSAFMLDDDPNSLYRIVDKEHLFWEIPYIIGSAHLHSGDPDSAEFYFEWLSRSAPSLPEGFYMLGQVAIMRGDDNTAARIYRNLLTRIPTHADSHLQLAEVLLRLEHLQDALFHFRYSLALQPDNAKLKGRIDEVIRESGAEEAINDLFQPIHRDAKTVVFITIAVRWREAKLASALRARGWKVVLLFRNDTPFHPSKYFDDFRHFETPWDAVALAREYNASIYHVFCHQYYDTPTALMLYGISPIIVDCKDQLKGMFQESYFESRPHFTEQVPLEQFALENADGICSRSLMPQIVKPEYCISAPTLFYPEYCWNSGNQESAAKLSALDGELHVVYAGSMLLKTKDGEYAVESYRWLAEVLIANNIHFHIYPINGAGDLEELRSGFAELYPTTPYFHFHEPVFDDEWLSLLGQYDVGVAFCFPDETDPSRNIITEEASGRWYAGKVADYIDAGVVLLTNANSLNGWLAKRYGFGDMVDWVGVNSAEFWQSFANRVLEGEFDLPSAKEKWSITEHAPRLESFYEKVISHSDLQR